MKLRILLSILTGSILIAITTNIIRGTFDIPRDSPLLAVSIIAICMGVCILWTQKKTVIRFTGIDLFMLVLTIGYLISHSPFTGLWNTGGSSLLLIFWIIRLTTKPSFILIYYFILISTALLIITGYLQYFDLVASNSPYFSTTGPYRNPSIFAGILSLLLGVIVTSLLYLNKHMHCHVLSIISILLLLTGIPLLIITTCRAAWAGFTIVVFLNMWDYYYQKNKIHIKRVGRMVRLGVGGILIIIFCTSIYGLYRLKPESAEGRLLIWKITWNMIQEHPLTGYGSDGFYKNYMHYQAHYLKTVGTSKEKQVAGSNHLVYNEPLRMTVEYGIAGLFLYFCFLYITFKKPVRKTAVTVSARSVLIASSIWGFFSYPNESFSILTWMLMACLCLTYYDQQALFTIKPAVGTRKVMKIIVFIVICILSNNVYKQYRVLNSFYKTSLSRYSSDSSLFIYLCSTMESSMQYEPVFWMHYCDALNKMKYDQTLLINIENWEKLYPTPDTYIMKGELMERLGQPDRAEQYYWLAHYMCPSRQKARSKLAMLYKYQGKMEEALNLTHEILTEKVKNYGFDTYLLHQELKRIFENHY